MEDPRWCFEHYIKINDTKTIVDVIENGFNINDYLFSNKYYTPLLSAIIHGNYKVVQYLIHKGANLNIQNRIPKNHTCHGFTPLMHAVYNEDFNLIKLLLTCGANPHIKSSEGLHALKIAWIIKNEHIFNYLKNKIKINK